MSLEDLRINGLYIVLFARDDPPKPDDFHWAFYFHTNQYGGIKYHIKSLGSGWIADHGSPGDIFKSLFLVGLFHVADIPEGQERPFDTFTRSSDNRLNVKGMTCRVWLFMVLKALADLVGCVDLEKLEREVKDWGNEHAESAAKAVQPRPVGASTLCRL